MVDGVDPALIQVDEKNDAARRREKKEEDDDRHTYTHKHTQNGDVCEHKPAPVPQKNILQRLGLGVSE